MHDVDGMSQIEIAETLGITRRTVFSRLRKVARIGRDLLEGDRGPRRRSSGQQLATCTQPSLT
jgi:DNA-directed RNA polymerase specialized sigma24 family protein